MTFFLVLVGFFAILHVPPLGRLARATTHRDRMRVAAGLAFVVASLPLS